MDKCIICNTRKWIGKYKNGKCDDCNWTENARIRRYEQDSYDVAQRKRDNRRSNDYAVDVIDTSLSFNHPGTAIDNSHCHSNHNHSSHNSYESHFSNDSSSECSSDCGGCD